MAEKKRNPYGGNDPDRQRLATPHWFMNQLRERGYNFGLDVCAEPATAVCERFFSKEDDGLKQSWEVAEGEWWWCNPPFGNVLPWIKHGVESVRSGYEGMMLLPCAIGTQWWREYCAFTERTKVVVPRLAFWDPVSGELQKRPIGNVSLWELSPDGAGNDHYDCVFDYIEMRKPKGAVR